MRVLDIRLMNVKCLDHSTEAVWVVCYIALSVIHDQTSQWLKAERHIIEIRIITTSLLAPNKHL